MELLTTKTAIYYYNQGIASIESNNITSAVENFENALKFERQNVKCLNALGLCYYILGLFDKAISIWKVSIELQPQANEAVTYQAMMDTADFNTFVNAYNLCLEFVEKGRYAAALKCILPYTKKYPYLVSVINLTGLLYYKLGFCWQAVKQWKMVLQYDCGNAQAICYIRDSETEGMLAWIKNMLRGALQIVWQR